MLCCMNALSEIDALIAHHIQYILGNINPKTSGLPLPRRSVNVDGIQYFLVPTIML